MRVSEVIDAYIAMKTSLGMSFDSARRLLGQFSREIGNPTIGEVQAEAAATFLRGRGGLNATWGLKYRILSGFYKFAISRGHVDSSPLRQTFQNCHLSNHHMSIRWTSCAGCLMPHRLFTLTALLCKRPCIERCWFFYTEAASALAKPSI